MNAFGFDLKIGTKRFTIVSLFRSPSQYADKFERFMNKLYLTMESITQKNPFLAVIIGNFNSRLSKRWTDDKTTQKGLKIENLFFRFSLSQVINRPTHICENFNSSIDLLFTNQQNLINDSEVHSSLHSNIHYQIIYGKFNLKIFSPPRTKDILCIINKEMLI